jgi:FixJ family two-component response regulator
LSNARIISVVDDDESVRLALGCLLRSLGLESCSFASAEDFLRSACLRDSDCVIADIQMPGMSGLELQEVMLAQGLLVPIIFITAFPAPRIRERAEAAGAVAILEKPFDAQVVLDSLDVAFERRPPRT